MAAEWRSTSGARIKLPVSGAAVHSGCLQCTCLPPRWPVHCCLIVPVLIDDDCECECCNAEMRSCALPWRAFIFKTAALAGRAGKRDKSEERSIVRRLSGRSDGWRTIGRRTKCHCSEASQATCSLAIGLLELCHVLIG